MKIGIPEGLFFYKYYPLWRSFFEELGAEVILSGKANKNTLDAGVKLCVDEACLPVKLYHGQVNALKSKADAIFIPRIMSVRKNEYICPKFCGMPEMIKNSIPDIPYVIDTTINMRKSGDNLKQAALQAGSFLTRNPRQILNALRHGVNIQEEFESRLKECGDFYDSLGGSAINKKSVGGKIGIIGHPYIIYDSFLNMDIFRKLKAQGYEILTPQMIDDSAIDEFATVLGKRHFWTLGREILGTGMNFIIKGDVDGIIYLSSFCCGIDSLMEDFLERRIRKEGRLPYIKLILDEHSGEAGFNTRVEAFLDMIKWRRDNEGNIPAYGRDLYSSKGLS